MAIQIDKAGYAAWRNGEISIRSLILHSAGCLLIGTPDSLEMPQDFYYISGDRVIPHPNDYSWDQQRSMLYVDTFRRELTRRVANWCMGIALLLFVACLVLQGVTSGVKTAYRKADSALGSMFHKDPATMSRADAEVRLRELKGEFNELRQQPAPDVERVRKIQQEAETLVRLHPDLQYVLQEK